MRLPWQRSETEDNGAASKLPSNSLSLENALTPTTVAATAALTTLTLVSARLYRTRLRRIPTAAHIPPSHLHEDVSSFPARHSILGVIVRVSDGDGVRVYHTPGGRLLGWGWLRRIPSAPFPRRQSGAGDKSWLTENTINVRLSGIDAPELAHFGHPAQPGAEEATDYLKELAVDKWTRVYPHVSDQYGRIVATPFVKKWHLGTPFGLKRWVDVGAEVVREGWATAYEGKIGVAFGGSKREKLLKGLEKAAKDQKLNIWSGMRASSVKAQISSQIPALGIVGRIWRALTGQKKQQAMESPRDFKARMKKQDEAEKGKQ